ncbi:putative pertactin [Bordetella bronchiseptica 99-R-0433]|uniref:autotransporter outer membrane beta-barrel domain-containing protein n=2 Tax=Bordetella bronchiseptica TaxID=518 RepID=UPI00045B16FF|nr:autotransporter outer membrane beta-barrel domain-containing protein [Bordetella bronchiseptica]KCV61076.1 putative pertactin [Bordetella bronchiseptica 99-R-0433]
MNPFHHAPRRRAAPIQVLLLSMSALLWLPAAQAQYWSSGAQAGPHNAGTDGVFDEDEDPVPRPRPAPLTDDLADLEDLFGSDDARPTPPPRPPSRGPVVPSPGDAPSGTPDRSGDDGKPPASSPAPSEPSPGKPPQARPEALPEAPPAAQPDAQPDAPPEAPPEAPPVMPEPAEPPAAEPPAVQPARPAGDAVYLPGTRTLTPTADAALGTASAAQGLWQAEMNALGKRMGELRLTPAAGGVWGRAFAQRQKLENGAARELRQTVGGFEVGADTALAAPEGRWHVGAVAGYSQGKLKFGGGATGEGDSAHVGAYATYIEDGGFYLDGIVRVARYAHAFKAPDAKGRRARGRYRANGVGASLELGRRFTWADAWYVEPQLEMAVFHAQGGSYSAGKDLRVKDGGLTSLLGRAGLHVGRQFDLGDGRVVQPYAKLSWLQEFDGKNTVRTNGIRHKSRLDGGRVELDVGVAAQLGRHGSLYGSYEYAKGSRQTMPWTFHIGYRYTW